VYVVPQYNPAQIHADWTPLLKRLSQDTGFDLQLVVMPSIPKFEQALLKGLPDIVLVNPYHAVMAKSAKAYMPFLRDAKPLTGILLVRQDSPYQSIQDLKGKEIVFPAPNAFGASLFLRALLTDAKVTFTEKYLNTHGNVYRHILNGTVAAGGGINLTLNEEPIEIRSQLRVLYQTPPSAPHPLMAHPSVASKKIEALSNAIVALRREPQGMQLLKQVRMPEPTIADYERDYLPLEKLEIEKFVVIEKD
jgi:phosphonate transport system substrate-binding protein